jgi:hypothetical protein
LGFEADLKALVDGKVRALLIPASSSRPITKTDFDLDKLSQYKVARHDTRLVFLTKKNAKRDELWKPNSLASEYVRNHSDAAKDPDSRLDPPEDLYGDVIVVGYDWLSEMITDLTKQLTELKQTLEWMAPFQRIRLTLESRSRSRSRRACHAREPRRCSTQQVQGSCVSRPLLVAVRSVA